MNQSLPYCEIYLTLKEEVEVLPVLGPVVGVEEQVQVGVGVQLNVVVQMKMAVEVPLHQAD